MVHIINFTIFRHCVFPVTCKSLHLDEKSEPISSQLFYWMCLAPSSPCPPYPRRSYIMQNLNQTSPWSGTIFPHVSSISIFSLGYPTWRVIFLTFVNHPLLPFWFLLKLWIKTKLVNWIEQLDIQLNVLLLKENKVIPYFELLQNAFLYWIPQF